ncbi:uncharacterized protein LOC119078994 [Bradysia coprophila]|uniref:uncharacterized protein LOC119078994 n=1 Tax=Bradysia coprophila TaxID=38358 RepID=UPI00187DD886|nr:uncharacterized protein LOC119078994 [Bradysia coprophila]
MKYTATAIVVLSNCFTLIVCFMIIAEVHATRNSNEMGKSEQNVMENGCSKNSNVLVIYKLILHTYWTREMFPKHYPDWRPQAQWSKTFGHTHDASFKLFSIGKVASGGMKMFAETGQTNDLELESTNGAFEFIGSAILSGSGHNEANIFADANHTLVSFATKITPSPDWFVGVDSLKLCENGHWLDNTTVELHPLDAGTDNGFTFTAPDWPTEPTGIIYRITSGYPAHQAGSFFYPQLKELPPIAAVTFIKLKEYQLVNTFHETEEEIQFDPIKTASFMTHQPISMIANNELSAEIEEERRIEEMFMNPFKSRKDRIRSQMLAKINLTINSRFNETKTTPSSITSNIKNRYSLKRKSTQPSKDCRVGDWSEWSPCTKSCGIGEMQRYRKVIRHAKYGGRQCPALKEAKWCELERDCISDYF